MHQSSTLIINHHYNLLSTFIIPLIVASLIIGSSVFFLSESADAETSGKTGDCSWSVDGTELTISGNGAMGDYNWSYNSPWQGSGITTVIIEEGVTRIGANAFSNCYDLSSVSVPETVSSIGEYAFYYCSALSSISLPDSVGVIEYSAFQYSGLTTISLSDNLQQIYSNTFSDCANLVSIELPSSLTNVGYAAFQNSGLSSVVFNNNLRTIDSYAFANCHLTEVELPESLVSIGEFAFAGNNITAVVNNSFLNIVSESSEYGNVAQNAGTIIGNVQSSTVNGLGVTYNTNSHVVKITSCSNEVTSVGESVSINGVEYRVVSISNGIFTGNTSIRAVIIPEGTTSIQYQEFKGCLSLRNVQIPESVTYIDNYAFSGCTSLQYVDIPANVTYIGYEAFSRCTTIAELFIPQNVSYIGDFCFQGCASLKNIVISENIQTVSPYMFEGCTSLSSIHLPDTLKSIGYCAFQDCTSLTNIQLPANITNIDYSAFQNCRALTSIQIPEGITVLSNSLFSGCASLQSIELPQGIISIGQDAFNGCESLASFQIPEGVTIINSGVFSGCTSLTLIEIPEWITSIGSSAFAYCSSLTSIVIPEGITKLDYTFSYCTKLLDVSLPNSIEELNGTFMGCEYLLTVNTPEHLKKIGNSTFQSCSKLIGFELTDGLQEIGSDAFSGTKISNITIPESVTKIGGSAFAGCESLYSITLPSRIESIEYGTFNNCKALRSIIIPDNVTSIGNFAFAYCVNLQSVKLSSSLKEIGEFAFHQTYSLKHIDMPNTVSIIKTYAFGGSGLQDIRLPDSITVVGDRAFINCPILFVEFNGNIEWIDDEAFAYCNIETISLPDSVQLLGNEVFSNNSNLKSIYFSSGLRYIYADTFNNITLYDTDGITPINVLDISAIAGHTFSGPGPNQLIKDNYTITTIVDDELITSVRGIVGETTILYTKVGHTIQWETSVPLDLTNGQFVMPASNVILQGTSVPNKYPVSVFLSGGTIDVVPSDWIIEDGIYKKDVEYGTSATVIETLFRDAYKSHSDIEWIATSDSVNTYGLELSINWIPKKYEIRWLNEDGSLLYSSMVEYGMLPTFGGNPPTKEPNNYKVFAFNGWDVEPTEVTGTASYTATYAESDRYYDIYADIDGSMTLVRTRYGETPSLPENPTKPSNAYLSYRFEYWSPSVQPVTCDLTYTAVFSTHPRTYSVTWLDDEGNVLDMTEGLTFGSVPKYTKGAVTKAPTAEFTYSFSSWTPQIRAIDGDATYTAVFDKSRNSYTITWRDDEGKILEIDENVEYGTAPSFDGNTPIKYPTPASTFTFAGWDGYTAGMIVSGDIVFTAVFAPTERTYVISFVSEGSISTSVMNYGAAIVPPADPSKASDNYYNYAFSGWIGFTENMTVTSDAVFTASFASLPRTYNVTWLDDEGNVMDTTTGLTFGSMPSYTKGEVTKAPTAEYSFTFVKWAPQIKAVSGDTSYTAVFSQSLNEYTVTWKDEAGKILDIQEGVQHGTAPVFNGSTPIKNPDAMYVYTFAGWDGFTAGMTITQDTEFTAVFMSSDRYYTVAFSVEGNVVTDSLKYGTPIVAPSDPVKDDSMGYTYVFDSWIGYYEGITATQNIVFEAKFNAQPKEFNISFVSEGQTYYSYTGTYGSTVKSPDVSPMKDADQEYQYVFIGWEGFVKGLTKVDGDMTFNAVFSPLKISHLIQFTVDGKVASVQSLPFGSPIVAPADPVKASTPEFDYSFVSWGMYQPGMTVTGPIIFDAIFLATERLYTISFVVDGERTDMQMHYGETIVAPANPVKNVQNNEGTSYTFSHWNGFNQGMTVNGNAVFEAIFNLNLDSLTTGNTVIISIDANSLLNLSDSDFSKIMTKIKTEDGSFSLKVHKGKIKFDANSMESFDWDNVGITMDVVNESLTDAQKQMVGDRPVYDINLSNANGSIHKFNNGNNQGVITLSVRYDLQEGENPDNLSIWYMDGNELTEKRNCTYYEEDGLGYVQFETEHLSCYAVMYENVQSIGSSVDITVIAGIAVVLGIIAAVGIVVVLKRRSVA